MPTVPDFPAIVENGAAGGAFVVVCEHASNVFPAPWGTLGLTPDQQAAHIAWDPGALGLARGLARRIGAVLVHAPVSRLIYDCNRAPDRPGAMAERSEMHVIPGNAALSPEARSDRTAAVYLPFQTALHRVLADRMARGQATALLTIHSFTPVWMGQPRSTELGVIHDADPALALAILAAARAATGLVCDLNAPYSAADDVTHTLRLQATPYGLRNAMIEVRNDLIADAGAQDRMAATLAPVMQTALAALQPAARAG